MGLESLCTGKNGVKKGEEPLIQTDWVGWVFMLQKGSDETHLNQNEQAGDEDEDHVE